MEFCEKCGGMILISEGRAFCAGCGSKIKKKPKIKTSEKIEEKETIAVIKEKDDNVNPIVEIKCPQCKYKKAYFWTMQTRSGDESETKFYKCTDCKHTWRVYR
jgi:transcription factor S